MKLLDLYCGAGGASRGYGDAGFEIIGVDIVKQKNYQYEFIRNNVLDLEISFLRQFDVIHASPPCQSYSDSKHNLAWYFPDLIERTREMLIESGRLYIIENIPEAPLIKEKCILLCGTMFEELRVIRHRLFESNSPLVQPPHINKKEHPLVYTHDKRKPHYKRGDPWKDYLTVTGGGNSSIESALDAMAIDWKMFKREVNEAVPPPYTRYIGRKIIENLSII